MNESKVILCIHYIFTVVYFHSHLGKKVIVNDVKYVLIFVSLSKPPTIHDIMAKYWYCLPSFYLIWVTTWVKKSTQHKIEINLVNAIIYLQISREKLLIIS